MLRALSPTKTDTMLLFPVILPAVDVVDLVSIAGMHLCTLLYTLACSHIHTHTHYTPAVEL